MIRPFEKPIYVTQPLLPDKQALVDKIDEIYASKQLTNGGPQFLKLKSELQKYLGVPHVSLFCNGTLALQLAIKALDLTGEVITTPFTFPATPHSLVWNNITPVFCDIEPATFNIDPEKIEALITDRTSAILPVHVFGNPCRMNEIERIAKKYHLKVIYDAAHAFGVKYQGKPIGTFGDISMFSFHATKSFNTLEGGALTYADPSLTEKLYYLKNFGIIGQEAVITVGTNAKMNELQAAFGQLVLERIDQEIADRKRLTELYRERLSGVRGITLLPILDAIEYNYQYLPILVQPEYGLSRDTLFEKLKEYNVLARKYFYPLCSDLACYRGQANARSGDLTTARRVAREILCLPLYGELAEPIIKDIVKIIKYLTKNQ